MKIKGLILGLLLLAGCSSTPPTTTPPDTTPPTTVEPAPTPKLFALDSFEQPNLDTKNWKSEITRTVFKNQVTGFAVKGELCLLAGKALKMMPITIDKPSANQYPAGVYYDRLENLTADNCSDAVYAWLDLSETFEQDGLKITIKKLNTESLTPKIPLFVELSPNSYTVGMHKGVYKDNTESLVFDAAQMLVDHRIQPMKGWATPYRAYSETYGLKEYVIKYSPGMVSVPQDGNLALLNTDVTKYGINKPWFYVVDEPDTAALKAAKTTLANLKAKAPNVARMITTTFQTGYDIDIYCPVAEHLGHDGKPGAEAYAGKRLWLYVSCMSHGGCYDNRAWTNGKYTRIATNRTGTPDLVLDAPGGDAVAFYQLAIKYNLEALLYYNSIEQWGLAKFGVDVNTDQFNFNSNGDGTLLYPDYANKKPLATRRLKTIREASFFADAVIMSGSQSEVSALVNTTKDWTVDYSLREKIFSKLQ